MQNYNDLMTNMNDFEGRLSGFMDYNPSTHIGASDFPGLDSSSIDLGFRVGQNGLDYLIDKALPEVMPREDVYAIADSCRNEDGNVDYNRFCDALESQAETMAEARAIKEDYEDAKKSFLEAKETFGKGDLFTSFQKLEFDLTARDAGLEGSSGRVPDGFDIFCDVLQCLKGNIFEMLIKMLLKEYFSEKVSRPENGERVDRSENRSEFKSAFREETNLGAKATKQDIEAPSAKIESRSVHTNYCGADMKVEPRNIGGVSVWDTGKPVDRVSTVVNGEISRITVPSMRVADVAGNKYLVDPFGKAYPVGIDKPTLRLKEDVDGNSYIKQLDRSEIKAEAAKIEAHAVAEGKSVDAVKREFSEKAIDSYIKDATGRVENQISTLTEKIESAKDRIEGYNEQITRLDTAFESTFDKYISLEKYGGSAEEKTDLREKCDRLDYAKDVLKEARAVANDKVQACENAIDRYSNALNKVNSADNREDKLSALTKAESEIGRQSEVDDHELSEMGVDLVSNALEEADSVEPNDVDNEGDQNNDVEAEPDKEDIDSEPEKDNLPTNDAGDSSVESEEFSSDDKESSVTTGDNRIESSVEKPEADIKESQVDKSLSDVVADKISDIEKADKEIKTIKEERLPDIEAKIEEAKERLEQNEKARADYIESGEDYGEGVIEALNESVEDSKLDLDKLLDEKGDLEAKLSDLEKESAEANDVVSFVERGFENDAKLEIDSDGNIVATKFDGDGNLVSKEAISQDTGLPVDIQSQEDSLTAAIDASDLLQDIDAPDIDDIDNGFETDLDKIDRMDGDLARIEAEVSNDSRESQVEKPLENAIDNEPKDHAVNDAQEKAISADNQQDTAKDLKDTATNDQKDEAAKDQKDDPTKDQSEAKVEEDRQDLDNNIEPDLSDIVSAPQEEASAIADTEAQPEENAVTADEEALSGSNAEDDLDTEDASTHEVDENEKVEVEKDDDVDVVADATDKMLDRAQASHNEVEDGVPGKDDAIQKGESDSDISQLDIQDAINQYIDQGPEGDFSFSTDFLSNFDISPEDSLNALNDVVNERMGSDADNGNDDKFSDILCNIFEKEFQKMEEKIEKIAKIFEDLLSGNWEALGKDLIEMAMEKLGIEERTIDIVDSLGKDFASDLGGDSVAGEDGGVGVEEANCADFDAFTDAVSDMTEHDFGDVDPNSDVDMSPDNVPDLDVPETDLDPGADFDPGADYDPGADLDPGTGPDLPSDNLPDFTNDFGNDLDILNNGAEGAESEVEEVIEIIAELLA